MLREIKSDLRSELTPKLIALDKTVLKEPVIGRVLSFLSHSGRVNKKDEELLNNILKAIKPDKRGSTKTL